ncbi:MAG: 6-phosphofructokinase, partial [Gemmatimonadota bacterium]
MNHVGILTSGGDAPGMNAAIRAVVRTAVYQGLRISAIYRGYQGLIEGDIVEMGARSVANIIQRGGTVLRTARSKAFLEADGRAKAVANLHERP